MADFHWQTEDETEWPEQSVEEKRPKKRPSWQFPLLMLIMLTLTIGGLYSILDRRAEAAEEALKEDVRRTHELVLDAADKGDVELFTTFLSGANARWLELQRQAVDQERFDEVPWLGFRLDEQPYRLDEITLSPTLDEAAVTYTRWYQSGQMVGGEFALQHVAIYRRGEDRWLLAPPTAEFWGPEVTIREGQLTLAYPERDESHVRRLTEELTASLSGVCKALPLGECPDGWRIKIKLSTGLESEIFPTRIEGELDDLLLTLPAPSLLGLPLDGVGYEALLQSYRGRLHRELTAALTRYLADSPELVPPVLESGTIGNGLGQVETVLPGMEMVFACAAGTVGRLEWNVFHYSLDTGAWNVILQRAYSGDDSGFIVPLPGVEGGYAIQEYLRGDLLTARLLLWQEGETILVGEQTVNFDNALAAPYFFSKSDPTGRYLLIAASIETEDSLFVLDREMCDPETGCELQEVINVPIWSPGGEQMLLEASFGGELFPAERPLYRAGATGQNPVEVGMGTGAFWLDETRYGYSRVNEQGLVELVVADSADDEAEVWIEAADLMPLAPAIRNWRELRIWKAWASPANPGMIMLVTTPGDNSNIGPYDFFLLAGEPDGSSGPQVEWLFSTEFLIPTNAETFSPDGRFLLLPQRGTVNFFRDLETGADVRFDLAFGYYMGWTPDGRYYIQRSDDALTLTSPSTGHQMQILYDFSTCSNVQWLETGDN